MKLKFIFPFLLAALLGSVLLGCDTAKEREHPHAAAAWQIVTAPTCSELGSATGTCAECGMEMQITLEKIPHVYEREVIAPTCETGGYTKYSCACGYVYETEHVKPTGHTLTETVTPPTCEAEGYTTYTCACGYTYNADSVPPVGHTLTATVTPPTCAEAGFTHYACSVCDYERDGSPVPPLDHANLTSTRYYATISRDGYTLHTCGDCGMSFEDSRVAYTDIVSGAYVDNTEVLAQGVDISKWNHNVGATKDDFLPLDFEALKAAGMDFVILKAGSTLEPDPTFEQNYAAAKAAGLGVGVYFYAYSTTVEATLADADTLIGWLEGKQLEYPVYFDAEDKVFDGLGKETLTELCVTFIERLQEAGYYAALYTNTEWLYNRLDTDLVKSSVDVWYARYVLSATEEGEPVSPDDTSAVWKDGTAYIPGETDKRYGLWQYTCEGGIEGFPWPFDFNYAFKDYKPIMEAFGLNGF